MIAPIPPGLTGILTRFDPAALGSIAHSRATTSVRSAESTADRTAVDAFDEVLDKTGAGRDTSGIGDAFGASLRLTGSGSGTSTTVPTMSGSDSSWGVGAVPGSARFATLFNDAGARYDINPRLLAAVAKQESNFNPRSVSSAGATGLMQFMPATARGLGIDPNDPAQAIDGAARYLRAQLDRFGSVELALAAYNAGPGAVSRAGGIPAIAETRNYVAKVMGSLGGEPPTFAASPTATAAASTSGSPTATASVLAARLALGALGNSTATSTPVGTVSGVPGDLGNLSTTTLGALL
ncbi:MAG: lytic transglycosylase domain-containing protein [Microthrixaceae bacterium]